MKEIPYTLHGSGRKVWWVCPSCGKEYQMAIYSRVAGKGCPECAKKQRWISRGGKKLLINKCPSLIEEWDYQKNSSLNLDPYTIDAYNATKVWWKCKECNNSWEASVKARSRGAGCPICGHKRSNEIRRIAEFQDSLKMQISPASAPCP